MRLQLNALCLLLTATPILSFDTSSLFSIFQKPQQDVAKPPETYEEFLARYEDGCPVHKFSGVRIVSRRPEIILIDGFLTDHEARALITIAYSPHMAPIRLIVQRSFVPAIDDYRRYRHVSGGHGLAELLYRLLARTR
jgi:hypothetical protein